MIGETAADGAHVELIELAVAEAALLGVMQLELL